MHETDVTDEKIWSLRKTIKKNKEILKFEEKSHPCVWGICLTRKLVRNLEDIPKNVREIKMV